MLINALCDYYDILAAKNIVLPDGYSKLGIHYLIALTPEGKLETIIDCQNVIQLADKKGKMKEIKQPKEMLLPKRSEKTAIATNFIEHRPAYIFGLIEEKGALTATDAKNKAKKSHESFVYENLEFIDGIDSPLVNAYRKFMESWQPEQETENKLLLSLGKNFSKSSYAFCLSGHPEKLLQDDEFVRQKWERIFCKEAVEVGTTAQCAVSGKIEPIARIHSKIKGIRDGQSSGTTLIGYNNPSEESYGRSQSYNSNVSEAVMRKYCEALNYLLASKANHYYLDGVTFVYWVTAANEQLDDFLSDILFGTNDKMQAEETQELLQQLMSGAKIGKVLADKLHVEAIDDTVDFYIVGIKPNAARLALKFCYHKKFGELLDNIAQHQLDLVIIGNTRPLSLWQLGKELVSPKSKNENVDPALLTKVFEAIVYNRPYPPNLLAKVVQRVKIDADINGRKAGLIKACLNRYSRIKKIKEEFGMALNINDTNQAYLCGRLFACLERVQDRASNGDLNKTIKDTYFGAAVANPNVAFPRLMHLYSFHVKKLTKGEAVYYEKLIGGIMDMLQGHFPGVQVLEDQGRFIIGYYQQKQDFFKKKDA